MECRPASDAEAAPRLACSVFGVRKVVIPVRSPEHARACCPERFDPNCTPTERNNPPLAGGITWRLRWQRVSNPCRKACSASRFTTTATATRSVLVHRGQTFGLPHIVRDSRSQEPSAAILRRGAPAQVHELGIIFKGEWPQPYTTGIGEMERLTHKILHYECCSPGQRTRGILGTSGSGASSSRTRSQSSDSSLACRRRLFSSNASWPVHNRSCMSQRRPCAAAASATSAACRACGGTARHDRHWGGPTHSGQPCDYQDDGASTSL